MDEITPIAKGILAVFPVGSGAVTWWNERKSKKEAEELKSFMDWAVVEITKLNNKREKIDNDFINSEEFNKLLTRIVSSILSEHTNVKKNIYKNILINSIKGIKPTEFLKEQYLHILDITSPTEIAIMKAAYKIQKNLPAEARQILHEKGLPETGKITIREIAEELKISPEETLNIVWSLTGRGLAFSLTNELSVNDNFVLTPFGANFCLFITLDG
jgi:hypothetical protein